MKLAVVLVSDQTIPNVVYLKNLLEYGEGFDRVLLITTDNMEKNGKSDVIVRAFGGDFFEGKRYDKIKVNEKMLFDVNEKLMDYFKDREFDKVFVNITGGNKIMSLATYRFFNEFDDEKMEMVYLPIGSVNYKRIKPLEKDGKALDVPLRVRMSVDEYLRSLGVEYEASEPLKPELSKYIFELYLKDDSKMIEITRLLRRFRENSRDLKKIKQTDEYKKIKTLLGEMGINIDDGEYNLKKRRWVDFLSGGWFEEYVYSKIKEMCVDDVKLNVLIKRDTKIRDVKNEFDVVFIKDNNLYVVECKTGDMSGYETTNALYKVAQLNNDLGLAAKSYFVSLSKSLLDDNTKKSLQARSKLLKVKFMFRDKIESDGIEGAFKEFQCK